MQVIRLKSFHSRSFYTSEVSEKLILLLAQVISERVICGSRLIEIQVPPSMLSIMSGSAKAVCLVCLPQTDVLLNGRLALINGKLDAFISKLLDELCILLLNILTLLIVVSMQRSVRVQIVLLRVFFPF